MEFHKFNVYNDTAKRRYYIKVCFEVGSSHMYQRVSYLILLIKFGMLFGFRYSSVNADWLYYKDKCVLFAVVFIMDRNII